MNLTHLTLLEAPAPSVATVKEANRPEMICCRHLLGHLLHPRYAVLHRRLATGEVKQTAVGQLSGGLRNHPTDTGQTDQFTDVYRKSKAPSLYVAFWQGRCTLVVCPRGGVLHCKYLAIQRAPGGERRTEPSPGSAVSQRAPRPGKLRRAGGGQGGLEGTGTPCWGGLRTTGTCPEKWHRRRRGRRPKSRVRNRSTRGQPLSLRQH